LTNVISLHRRLDRLSENDGESMAEALVQAQRDDDARQAAWTAAGHPGAPPDKAIPPMSPDASFRAKRIWRLVAEGRARVIHGKAPDTSPFASLGAIYTLADDALLAAINSHPLYAGWPEYDDKPDAEMPA
jgi:hypothetical protein